MPKELFFVAIRETDDFHSERLRIANLSTAGSQYFSLSNSFHSKKAAKIEKASYNGYWKRNARIYKLVRVD